MKRLISGLYPFKYSCHINVEVCATSNAVKYIYNYVYKGADMTMVTIEGETQGHSLNKILYLYAVIQASYSRIHAQRRKAGNPFTRTKLCNIPRTCEQCAHSQVDLARRQDNTAFFMVFLAEPEVAGKMLYKDILTVYHWDKIIKVYKNTFLLSAASYMYLHKIQNGFTCVRYCVIGTGLLEDLRAIDGVTYATFHEAAMAAVYLDKDSEWEVCLLEASHERMPYPRWQLFGIILVYTLPNSPLGLWERFKNDLSEDFQREFGLDVDDRKIEYKALQSLDNILRVNGKTLENYGLPVLQDYELEAAVDEQVKGDKIRQELNAYPLEQ
ncbi:Helitron helicase-like protein [Phytophthora palmivora]|uniref:Helitron helicase-like protein n=1 Tax=Phytophthora palmivora TaxID=4796 RepID=A0A2P4XEL8_9STRA|nr:Helitron helicase-like protein [Phytophthora palmivora]